MENEESARPTAHCAMSVDVEDYFQVWAFQDVVERRAWDGFAPRVGDATRACLDAFAEADAKATFFILGWVAERDPDLIRAIAEAGHEIASHGYDHTKVNLQSRGAFREDAAKTKSILEDASGQPVRGYRAAGFSIDASTPWAYETLRETGHDYSSSLHPIAHDHYGDANAPRTPFRPIAGDAFVEAPVATARIAGRNASCAGGGWFRLAPYPVFDRLFRTAARQLDGPLIFYFHPWEIDADQPRIASAPIKSKIRHYTNLKAMTLKLRRLLSAYRWGRIDHAIAQWDERGS